ncbi:MAG: glycosyltransferase family 9 protein [Gammaproteobacteria bacterium]|nr:glycosyltransferase family 9 protein [Gammaproteobacteria bacterium]
MGNGTQETRIATPPDARDGRRILVIRRDNIGDLVCTLPLLSGLRQALPEATIDVLANSYNAPLLRGNPDIDTVHQYTKSKHRPAGGRLRALIEQTMLLRTLRRRHYDAVLVASGGGQRLETRLWLRLLGARRLVMRRDDQGGHEVERALRLGHALGLKLVETAPQLHPDPALLQQARGILMPGGDKPIGLHISAREDENRWPPERFEKLIREGTARGLRFALFWSPGPGGVPEHPGHDDTASRILAATQGLAVTACPTARLAELAAALACCRRLVGSDGGHCHIAAAVGTPVVGLYCDHKVEQWRPWGTAHVVLSGRRVDDIPVARVLEELLAGAAH